MPATPRILCIEDEQDIRLILELALGRVGGFDTCITASGAEGLAQFDHTIDLVLLDAVMPDLDGPATLEALRALPGGHAVPVLFLTGRTEPDDLARYRALGATGVVAKPFDPMTLAEQVRKHLP